MRFREFKKGFRAGWASHRSAVMHLLSRLVAWSRSAYLSLSARCVAVGFTVWLWGGVPICLSDPAADSHAPAMALAETFAVGDVTVFARELVYSGDAPAAVSGVRPSCTCLRVLEYPAHLTPGVAARFWIAFRPDRVGSFAYWLAVHLGDGEPLRLEIAGTASDAAGSAAVAFGEQAVTGSASRPVDVASLWDLPPSFLSRARSLPDPSLFIPASDLSDALADADSVAVDVRPRSAYVQCHVPGALNVPVHVLSTRPFLRGRDVILLDEGWCGETLIASAEKLRASGASTVRVVWGGLAELARRGYRFEGRSGGLHELAAVPSAVAYDGLRAGCWVVVDESGEENVVADMLFPARVRLAGSADPDETGQALQRAAERCDPGRSILLVNRDGDYPEATDALRSCTEVPVFQLAGGWNALAHYLIRQGAYTQHRTVHSVRKSGCAGCP